MRPRRGSMFLEVCLATVILVAAFGVIAHLLVLAAQQQRGHECRRLATREAANVMERVMALEWEDLTQEQVASLDLPDNARQRLPDAGLDVQITAAEGTPARKRVRIRVDWRNHAGQRERPVQVVAWKHSLKENPAP